MSTDTTITQKIEEAIASVPLTFGSGDEDASTRRACAMYASNAVSAYTEALDSIEQRSEGWKFDWSSVGAAMSAEAAIKFWFDVVATSSPSEDELTITTEGLTEVLLPRARNLLRNSGGQSTSAISNVQDRVEADLTARLINSFGEYIGIPRNLVF